MANLKSLFKRRLSTKRPKSILRQSLRKTNLTIKARKLCIRTYLQCRNQKLTALQTKKLPRYGVKTSDLCDQACVDKYFDF